MILAGIKEEIDSVDQCATLADLLLLQAKRQPDAMAYRFLVSGDTDGSVEEWTYGQLALRACMIAARLQDMGAEGERALLVYPPGLDFVAAFLGCACAGVVVVPTYPHPKVARLEAIARNAKTRFILTTSAFLGIGQALSREAQGLAAAQWMATDDLSEEWASKWRQPEIDGEALAFLQYTSGSTGQPKGVMVTHANILHNQRMIMRGFSTNSSIHVVGWLPLYHDMGLIGNVLHPLFLGASCTLMSPMAFLQQPMRWPAAISHFRGTVSGGPNFAYDLCVRKMRPEHKFDLSSWKVAYNGAEALRTETLDRFTEAFGPHGFRREAFYPCYGLAEATLFVTGSDQGQLPVTQTVVVEALERNLAVAPSGDDTGVRSLVSSGHAQAEQPVLIVDPETLRPCPDNTVGEIWVTGPGVAKGYWGLPEQSEYTFSARLAEGDGAEYLRTGDLGFLRNGELFVTGRIKDLIIIRGRNLYPHDIEFTAQEAHPAVRQGGCAAFSLDVAGQEKLALAAEVLVNDPSEAQAAAEALRRAVAAEHGTRIHTLILLKPKALPKTSSGKIQRNACRQSFLAGTLDTLAVIVRDDVAGKSRPA